MANTRATITYSVLFTALMIALILFVYNFKIPNPNMILIAALVLSTSIGGTIPGVICAVIMMIYSLFFFSVDHSFVQFTEENTYKIIVIAIGVVINFVSVAILKRNRDRAGAQLKKTNQELVETNEKLAQTNEELKRVNGLLKAMASRDSLTNLRNRYALRQDFELYIGQKLHVMFMDFDDFKMINDTKGHDYGDNMLVLFGKALTENFRASNCYRYGGDEFLVISENESLEKFQEECENTKKMLERSDIGFSGGYVTGTPLTIDELRNMINQADEMLYQVKREGKNKYKGCEFDPDYVPGEEAAAYHINHWESDMI